MRTKFAVTIGLLAVVLAVTPYQADASEKTTFAALNEDYEAIRVALLNDNTKGVSEHARAMESSIAMLNQHFSAAHAGVSEDKTAACEAVLPVISKAAARLAKASNITEARDAFGELSKPMVRYREMVSGDRPVVVYCSMAKKAWLQPGGEIGNPYYGQSMAKCGDVISK